MSFQDLSIQIQEATLDTLVTEWVEVLNVNSTKFKEEIERVVNSLEIDTTAKAIGVDDPINSIYVKNIKLLDYGLVLHKTDGPTTTEIASLVKNIDNKSVLTIDIININEQINTVGLKTAEILITSLLTATGPINSNDVLNINGGVKESINNGLILQLELDGTTAVCEIDLTEVTEQNIFLILDAEDIDHNVYDPTTSPSWQAGVEKIEITVNIDATKPIESGFKVGFILAKIIDNVGNDITTTCPVDIVLVPGENKDTSLAITFANSKNSIEFLAETYESTAQLLYVVIDTVDYFQIMNTENCIVA